MAKAPRACTILLRLLTVAATLAAAIVMATSHETTRFFGVTMESKFQYTPAFKFFVIANAIGSGYSLLVLLVPPTSSLSRFVIVLDVVIAMLLTAGISATGAIAQVGKHGNSHAGWLPICGQVPKYCDHVMGALISAFCGALIQLLIVLHTIHTAINPLLP